MAGTNESKEITIIDAISVIPPARYFGSSDDVKISDASSILLGLW